MKLVQTLVQVFRPWGGVGAACGVLLAAAAALHLGFSREWQVAAERSFELANAQNRRPTGAQGRDVSAAQGLQSDLPDVDLLHQRLAVLLDGAGRHNLRMGDSDVSQAAGLASGTLRWRVAVLMQGTYADIRRHVQAVLAADSAISLDQIRLSRAQVDATDLRAELVWSLHSRAVDGTQR